MSAGAGLERFIVAQEQAYARSLDEIRRGKKRSHWMWYIFPQIAGLGRSAMAQRSSILRFADYTATFQNARSRLVAGCRRSSRAVWAQRGVP